jgi:alanyl-tRNA synthetase
MGQIKTIGRAANTQKCIRAGGKHNDLDDVGRDTYHHTFFEMLGNWSFGNYFKVEAIDWAWDLLTKVYGMNPDRLYATYFGGDEKAGLAADEEARQLWLKYLPAERVLPFGMKDNFWEMGDTGPCGPCSEIHYDRIGGRDAASLVNMDDPTVIEIWNLVFMQFNREVKNGPLVPLPAPCVDTGMGFERLTSVLQDVHSNYDTDIWTTIFKKIQEVTGYPEPYRPGSSMEDKDIAYRVIADHIRTLSFAIADGGAPDSVGRGFVLRRIVRRAVRYGKEFLGAKDGFFQHIVDAVVESMSDTFPELKTNQSRIKATLAKEEELFGKTWETGMKHFGTAVTKAKDNSIRGEDAFILHDRYGFPVDLTLLMAEKQGLGVDMKGFDEHMQKQKDKNKDSGAMAAKKGFMGVDQLNELETIRKVAPTVDEAKYVWEDSTGKVVAIYNHKEQTFPAEAGSDAGKLGILLDKTNFYSEAGGQVGDIGTLVLPGGVFKVEDTQTYTGYTVHIGTLEPGAKVKEGDEAACKVDLARRLDVAANHTGTHILNFALRQALIRENDKNQFEKVDQKGSLVDEKMARFDFTWPSKLTEAEIARTEELVNEEIAKNGAIFTQEVEQGAAMEIVSLRSVFGEKYPPVVRVVSIGKDIPTMLSDPKNPDWWKHSVEFCGGTHLKSMGEAQKAVIVQESAIGGNVRRILMYTRQVAADAAALAESFAQELTGIMADTSIAPAEKLKVIGVFGKKVDDSLIPMLKKVEVKNAIKKAIDDCRAEEKKHTAKVKQWGTEIGEKIAKEVEESKLAFVVRVLNNYQPLLAGERDAIVECGKALEKQAKDTPTLLILKDPKKGTAHVIGTVPKDKTDKLAAPEWVQSLGCKGGGKPVSASGAGLANDAVEESVKKAEALAEQKLA